MNKCLKCGIEIPKGRKFCCLSHSASYNNVLSPKRHNDKAKPNCTYCGKGLKTYTAKFCGVYCQMEYQYETKYIPLILEGNGNIGGKYFKRYLKEIRGAKCEICTQSEIWNDLPLTLQVDHIDGNSDNNDLKNLRLLCPNCHTQTETFTGRNTKNTKRNSYLKKYKKGIFKISG